MENSNSIFMTKEGLKKVEDELDILISEKRLEIAEKIKEAKAFGDLSENSEYDEAKNEQADLESRIAKLQNIVKNSVILDEKELEKGKISLGSVVVLFDEEFDEEVEFTIVGTTEADPLEGKISNLSPLGKALMGKKSKNVVTVEAPEGDKKYKVLKVTRK